MVGDWTLPIWTASTSATSLKESSFQAMTNQTVHVLGLHRLRNQRLPCPALVTRYSEKTLGIHSQLDPPTLGEPRIRQATQAVRDQYGDFSRHDGETEEQLYQRITVEAPHQYQRSTRLGTALEERITALEAVPAIFLPVLVSEPHMRDAPHRGWLVVSASLSCRYWERMSDMSSWPPYDARPNSCSFSVMRCSKAVILSSRAVPRRVEC